MSILYFIRLNGDDLDQSIRSGLAEASARHHEGVALVFPEAARIGANLAGTIGAAAESHPGLRELVLVHPGASVGFLASSLGLRMPNCRVRAERDMGAASNARPKTLTPSRGSAQIIDMRERPIDEAFTLASSQLRVRSGNRAVLLLNPKESPPPGLSEVIVREMALCPKLRELTVIHPSAVMTFVIAAANRQLSGLTLVALATTEGPQSGRM